MTDFKYSILSDIGGRKENQDFVLTTETTSGFLMVVCDGMGGANGGKLASETAAKSIESVILNHKVSDVSINEAKYFPLLLKRALDVANKTVFDLSNSQPGLRGMGTTACIVLLRNDIAYIAHVGDSRIYHISGGTPKHTSDHSRVFQLYQNGILTKEQAREHPESNIITRAIGIHEEIEADYDELELGENDLIISCTDGIWGVFPEKELLKRFNSKTSLDEIGTKIIAEINAKFENDTKSHDNLSIGMIRMSNVEYPKSDSVNSDETSNNEGKLSMANKTVQFAFVIILLLVVILFYLLNKGGLF